MTSIAPAPTRAPRTATVPCAGDPERMFPLEESTRANRVSDGEAAALQVCAGCSVLAQCREKVLTVAPLSYGVAGGMTSAQRRAARAAQRGLGAPVRTVVASTGADAAPGEPRSVNVEPAGLPAACGGDGLDVAVASVLAVHPQVAGAVDVVTVRALARGERPAMASRWEVALAAMVLLARGSTVAAATRLLGENQRQLGRWQRRHEAGEPLVCGAPGIGTTPLHRPGRGITAGRVTAGRAARGRGAA